MEVLFSLFLNGHASINRLERGLSPCILNEAKENFNGISPLGRGYNWISPWVENITEFYHVPTISVPGNIIKWARTLPSPFL